MERAFAPVVLLRAACCVLTFRPLEKTPSLVQKKNTQQVRYLKVIEKSGYQALPWVRYITTAGNYEIRMNS